MTKMLKNLTRGLISSPIEVNGEMWFAIKIRRGSFGIRKEYNAIYIHINNHDGQLTMVRPFNTIDDCLAISHNVEKKIKKLCQFLLTMEFI